MSHIEPNTLVAGTTGIELQEQLKKLNEKSLQVEQALKKETKELQEQLSEWNHLDQKAEDYKNNRKQIVKFNISGKQFVTSIQTLLRKKDTLFYKLILGNDFDLKHEIYFDRCPKSFSIILNYLRYNETDITDLLSQDISKLIIEANYFEVSSLVKICKENLRTIKIIKVEYSSIYSSYCPLTEGVKLEELLTKIDNGGDGIATNSPGHIIIELSRAIQIDKIEVRGYTKNTSYFASSNGQYSKILTSKDKSTWNEVGTIPSSFGSEISKVTLTSSTAKYIKIDCTSYLGLSYFNIPKK